VGELMVCVVTAHCDLQLRVTFRGRHSFWNVAKFLRVFASPMPDICKNLSKKVATSVTNTHGCLLSSVQVRQVH